MKTLKYCLIIALSVYLAGCNDFLEEQSQDEVRPSTIIELQQLLNKEGYPSVNDNLYSYMDVLTDDVECFGPQGMDLNKNRNTYKKLKDLYLWSDEMFTNTSDTRYYNSWEILYRKILGCNLVLDYIDRVYGDEKQKQELRGQALGLRAYYYLILANLYGQPYNSQHEKPEIALCVPLMATLNFSDELPVRQTVKKVYDQIEQDLLDAVQCFEKGQKSNKYYQISKEAVWALLSRVYLYEENWDQVIEFCDLSLSIKQTLTKLIATNAKNVYSPESEEILWHYTGFYLNEIYMSYPGRTAKAFFQVSDELIESYVPTAEGLTDLRPTKYYEQFQTSNWTNIPFYGSKSKIAGINCTSNGIRVSEIYLNRAEAYIQKFLKTGEHSFRTKALADLNYLRSCRFDTNLGDYIPVEYTDGGQLLNFYKEERRKELCFEGLNRWCDLRRWGMPSFTHTYFLESGSSVSSTLKEGDLRYVLLIPEIVRDQNYLLQQNAR